MKCPPDDEARFLRLVEDDGDRLDRDDDLAREDRVLEYAPALRLLGVPVDPVPDLAA